MRHLSRVRMNMKEIANLKEASNVNRAIAADETKPEAQRVEAEQRIAEIDMRIQLLRMENDKL